MKKLCITVSFSFFIAMQLQAQEEQLDVLQKAVDTNTGIVEALEKANFVEDQTTIIKPELSARYYFLKGQANLVNKDVKAAARAFSKLSEIENGVFEVKNKTSKEKEYYFSKTELDKALTTGQYTKPKEITVTTGYGDKVINSINSTIEQVREEGTKAYNEKRYNEAGDKLQETYQLYQSVGEDQKKYLYYAAVAYQQGEELEKAAPIYEKLVQEKYDGIETTYYATNVSNDQKVRFKDEKEWNEFKNNPIQAKIYKDFTSETSEDISKDLYTYAASNYASLKNYDKATQIAEEGLGKFKNDPVLLQILENSLYESGNSEKYIAQLKENVKKNPNDAIAIYNLGVMLSKQEDEASKAEAEASFKKVLEIDPKYTNASLNLAALIMEEDTPIVKELTELNKKKTLTPTEDARVIALMTQRKSIHKSALPYLEQVAQANPNDLIVLKNLKISYAILGMTQERELITKRIATLESK